MTPSPCHSRWKRLLSLFADGELADRSVVATHLEVCERCRSWLEAVRDDECIVRSAFIMGPRPELVRDVMETVRLSGPVPVAGLRSGLLGSSRFLQGAATAMGAVVLAVVLGPLMAHVGVSARREACLSNLRDLSTAALVYANDNGQGLPSGAYWDREVAPYVTRASAFRCPECQALPAYGFSSQLAHANLARLGTSPGRIVVLFDQRAPSCDFAPRHSGKGGVAFADGHVAALPGLPGPSPLPEPREPAGAGRGSGDPTDRPGYLLKHGMDGSPMDAKDA